MDSHRYLSYHHNTKYCSNHRPGIDLEFRNHGVLKPDLRVLSCTLSKFCFCELCGQTPRLRYFSWNISESPSVNIFSVAASKPRRAALRRHPLLAVASAMSSLLSSSSFLTLQSLLGFGLYNLIRSTTASPLIWGTFQCTEYEFMSSHSWIQGLYIRNPKK
jgi:hypothetical protein